MFSRLDIHLINNPVCITEVDNINEQDFFYYDKDGFELNQAEQKFYAAQGFPIQHAILNHTCWQEPCFQLERSDLGLILDHSIFLCRANYGGKALEQLTKLKKMHPQADYLLRTRVKWGYDFALDAVQDNTVFEVLHVEYDNTEFEKFNEKMIHFDWIVRHTDWQEAASKIWQKKDQWQHLKGFEQNHWKAEYLLGWSKSEYTEKAV